MNQWGQAQIFQQSKKVEITYHSDTGTIPAAFELRIDTRLLTQEQFAVLKTIAADIDKRRGIIDATPR
jgi:hypothetical protein